MPRKSEESSRSRRLRTPDDRSRSRHTRHREPSRRSVRELSYSPVRIRSHERAHSRNRDREASRSSRRRERRLEPAGPCLERLQPSQEQSALHLVPRPRGDEQHGVHPGGAPHGRHPGDEQRGRHPSDEQRGRHLGDEQRGRHPSDEQRGCHLGDEQHGPRRDDQHGSNIGRHSRQTRSRSPLFSSKDVAKLVQSFKDNPSTQPSNAYSSNKLDYKNILPEFNPSAKNQRMDIWLNKVNECASVYGWEDRTTIHFAMQKLQGLAKTWYESQTTILFSWSEWQDKLLKAFPCEQNYAQSLEDMLKRKSKNSEPIENYFYEKLALINQCEISGKRAVDCLIHGLSDKTIRSSALAMRCSEPDKLLQFLMSNSEPSAQPPPKGSADSSTSSYSQLNRSNPRQAGLVCFNCKEKGHSFLKCPKTLMRCDSCRMIGHVAENCRKKSSSQSTKAPTVQKTMCITSSNPNDKYNKDVTVNGVCLEAFVDLGSEVTLIRESNAAGFGIPHDDAPTVMKGFGNELVQSKGSVSLNITIDGVGASVVCKIAEDHLLNKPMLIGQSYSEQPHIVIVKDASKLQFLDISAEIPTLSDTEKPPIRVRILKHSVLYGIASIKAATENIFSGNVMISTNIVGKPNEQYVVLGGIHQVENGFLYVTVSPCSMPCQIQENFVFARAERIELINRIATAPLESDLTKERPRLDKLDEKHLQIGSLVIKSQKTRLIDLLQRFENCFAFELRDVGCTNVTEMKIELTSTRPVIYRPYRLSHNERDTVRSMVNEMIQAGVVRESTSNYASPIILVRKKDGKTRLCIDYRMLNSITVKERYPMPIIDDEVSRLSGQAWYITLDLMSGYYQVPIAEEHKHLTAFVTPDGQYEFNRMPFGLANAPAVFQRMMNRVLGSARFNKATVYIDDVLIYGKDVDEALSRLEEVLELLNEANLKLNLAKCSFLQNKIDYLGYEISESGVRPGTTKIRSVSDFPRPDNVHSVRQFLGLVSYFRKFIQGFAEIAAPLTKLLKKDAVWEWTDAQEQSYTSLKDKLVSRPVLAIYDYKVETDLHIDASRVGIGGILYQRTQGSTETFKPVAYYSRQTTPEEKNFHSYELETLAVVCSLRKFRVYLLGKDFKIVTDCSALRSTFLKRDLIPRIARWWLTLREFDCSVEYRAGSKMAHADALSRNPIRDTLDTKEYLTVMAISDEDWLLTLQLGDSELGRIRDVLSSKIDSKSLDYIRENYIIQNNKLFKYLDGDRSNVRWVVPKGARWQVCKLNHDDIGHVGYEKTLDRIRKTYWFSKMARFVKKYVKSCIDCSYAKKSSTVGEGLLHPIPKIETPLHTLHIDHLGPFVRSKRGHTHILVIVDSFTKFVFIKPVKNTKSVNVIKILEDIFDTFRTPDRIISDRGSCFTSHAFKKFCLDRGTKHVLNAVASPRSNGQVERYNRTILDSLTAQNLRDDERDWDNKLGRIQWGLNNTLQKTIGRTPAEVMFGTIMNSERNPVLNELTNATRETRELSTMRKEVKNRIDREQLKQKENYDRGRKPAPIYKRGDLVKITKTAFQNDGKSTKLLPSYEGPYKVIKVLDNDRYKIAPIQGFEGMKNKRKTTVATDRMKPWIHITSLELGNDDEPTNIDDNIDEEYDD